MLNGASLHVRKIELANGRSNLEGAILNQGSLTVESAIFTGNDVELLGSTTRSSRSASSLRPHDGGSGSAICDIGTVEVPEPAGSVALAMGVMALAGLAGPTRRA